jgi:imidazolonepropionase-like amidohydrolase
MASAIHLLSGKLLATAALVSSCASLTADGSATAVVIDGATLVSADLQERRPAARIVIQGDRVRCIGAPADCPVPAHARRVDGSGRFVIPGLFDAHIHTSQRLTQVAPLYLAFGITSVRDMGGFPEFTRQLQDDIRSGALLGPRIYTSGRPIDGAPTVWPVPGVAREVGTAEEARAAVRAARDEGADFIKLYNALPPALVRAAVEEAHALRLRVTIDHILRGPEAVDAGVDGVEHLVPPPSTGLGLMQRYDDAGAAAQGVNVLKRMRDRGVALTTTMVLMERAAVGSLADTEPTYAALPPALRLRSTEMVGGLDREASAFMGATQRYACAQVRDFAAMGGTVLAGTDSYFLSSYPGDLHRELELLVGCGLTTAQALQAGTSAPAQWLGLRDVGVLEVGARADLLLLRADPLQDIRASRQIDWIVQGGRVYTPADVLRTVR